MTTKSDERPQLMRGEIEALLAVHFPQMNGKGYVIEAVTPGSARLRLVVSDGVVRPGGTISGPAMFTLADFGIYVALLAALGTGGLQAVTSNLNITFLARPEPSDLVADVTMLRLGRRQAVAEVRMVSERTGTLVAHAVGTYAIPRAPKAEA